ncbi:MAG: PfkB family carbohydrate kinase, partial [Clostridiales bacterium]|nr:PfkB family carbohydrate kinase [Clostridiales bacterium]
TLGKNGAILIGSGIRLRGYTPEITVKNNVGSGDAFLAGLAAGVSKNLSVKETLRTAMVASTAAAMCFEIGSFEQRDYIYAMENVKVLEL